jgi:hypothetical protein
MRSSFASRRPKARKIEADENEEDEDNSLEKPTEGICLSRLTLGLKQVVHS